MQEITLTINNRVGLHARPAARLVETAKMFESVLELVKDGHAVNAKSILSVLTLGAGPGASVSIRAQGPDEAAALAALRSLIESDFGEGEREAGAGARV